jgi:hypothetical protein
LLSGAPSDFLEGGVMPIVSHIWNSSTRKFPLLMLAALFVIGASSAQADPIPTFDITDAMMFMRPNVAGDHVSFEFTGPGVDIRGVGGMDNCFSWCSGDPIPPGTSVQLNHISVTNFTMAVVGGVAHDPNFEFGVTFPGFFNDSGGLNPLVAGFVGSGETFSEFRMTLPTNGRWNLNFAPAVDENGHATTRFVNGTFSATAPAPTPEPATFALMLVGSAAAGWMTRRRRTSRDA